ncbi:MAG: HAD hydrolase-like protein [Treponema sp.]|uniref:HAD hydrolase-like protein n=1 Tax=Treponema sp. TaxID=166 RepID=UPI0025FD85E5|nr:HAD hydrolase-like protein [Treponema sp.]MBQ9281140.1 HAD hydrolase-like protein [Treponema sp.]
MSIQVYVFDCDGTIIDSGEDIASCVNASLQKFGYWPVDEKELISFTGDGAKKLVLRALSRSTKNRFNLESEYNKNQFDSVFNYYLELYHSNPVVKTHLYAGIKELLRVLKEKDKKVVLFTNKPESIARLIFEKLGIYGYFDLLVGPETKDHDGNSIKLKPETDGLYHAMAFLNEKYKASYTKENFVMIGDSDVDIIAGKKFGCMTVGCRGGIANREKMLAENPDLSFSVASEIEKFIDILSQEKCDDFIKNFAMKNEVPIMQDEGSDFICGYITSHGVKSVLEIGTAIGYSTVRFAKLSPQIRVTTIELDEERYKAAVKNVEEQGLSERITLIHGDALTAEISGLFDLIFIDAAKAQYQKFFEKYKENLSENGVIITDNLSFHGMVEDLSLTHNYSTKKLVKKIRKYIEFLKANREFDTEFIRRGDGISVSRRKSSES